MRVILILLILLLGYFTYTQLFVLREPMSGCGPGYTKEFCQANLWPGTCLCDSGEMGRILPGGKGECICDANVSLNKNKYGLVAPPQGDYSTSSLLWPFKTSQNNPTINLR